MIYTKINPIGIDKRIQGIQKQMHDALLPLWAIESSEYDCYGRAYRNQDAEGKFIPEVFIGKNDSGKEYKDPLINDNKIVTSFFGVNTRYQQMTGNMSRASVSLIFSLNLDKVKSVNHRADEEVHMDILTVLQRNRDIVEIIDLVQGIDYVLSDYNGWKTNKGVIHSDLHPNHWFRVNFYTTFINTNC